MRQILSLFATILSAPFILADVALADPPPLDAYGALPGVEEMSISPSGRELAMVGRIGADRHIVVLGADHKVRTSSPLGDVKLRDLRWAGEDMVMVVTSATANLGMGFTADKVELLGAIIVHADGSKAEMVFANRSSMVRSIFRDYGTRFVDGKWVGYFGGVELKPSADRMNYEFDHGRPALFGVDLQKNAPRKVSPAASESYWRRWLVDAGGFVAATMDLNHGSGAWRVTNQRGTVIASGIDPTGDVDLISFSSDGAGVVYSTEDPASGIERWFEVPLAGGAPKEILTNIDIERSYIDPRNGRMLGYLEGGSTLRPKLFDPAQQAIIARVYKAFPKLDLQIAEWTPNFSHFLVETSGNGDSGTWYVVDVAARRADPVGYNYPLVPPEAVGPISTFAYKAGDGLDLDGILTLPPGRPARNLPVIMLPHGGPETHDKAIFHWWAQAFASRGYAVLQPNFRGSTNRDDAFRRAGYGQWGRKMQSDLSDGLAELAKQGIVDPKRACIVGASYGGYAALAGVTLQQGLYRCAVAVAPVSDLSEMYWTDYRESGDRKVVKKSLQESLGAVADLASVSPRRFAKKADAPILLIHGKDDTVVPFKQSSGMADALRDAGKPYEFITLREEDHWLSRSATRKQMLEATMRFVTKYNPAN